MTTERIDATTLAEIERLAEGIEPRWAWGARMCDMHRSERARRRRYIDAMRPEIILAMARELKAARAAMADGTLVSVTRQERPLYPISEE